MANILHRIGIRSASPENVYRALTTQNGLAGWWTNNTFGEGDAVGNVVEFRFEGGAIDIAITEIQPPDYLLWKVKAGPEEWIGTSIRWELKQDGDYIIVIFKHLDWREPVEFMHHCSTKWAIFLMSLKSLIETGKGNPDPFDIKIDNWN